MYEVGEGVILDTVFRLNVKGETNLLIPLTGEITATAAGTAGTVYIIHMPNSLSDIFMYLLQV